MILVINDGGETGHEIVKLLLKQSISVCLVERLPYEKEIIDFKDNDGLTIYNIDFYQAELIEPFIKRNFNDKIFTGLVYAAGIGGVRPLGLTQTKFLHEMMIANVYAYVEWVRCICKKNRFEAGGSVVAISSVSSIKGLKSKIAYSASKAALDAAVRGIASELADRKIRVNSIQKGWVSADMQHGFIQDNMVLSENKDLSKQVLGVIENIDLAKLVIFLLSEDSKFITGTNILLDGGYCLN
ncbi:MAG: SDR family NAD(P)-dependent oxidoreductase [Bacteroidia bacterium]